ncbi:MAG: rRNA maturation RNase YbeY [Woeseiaceae bacterium]|nr:rRNA maturation RNase YbeY [Woeseiaceae bacterium]
MSRQIAVEVSETAAGDVPRPGDDRIGDWVAAALEAADAQRGRDLEVAVLLADAAAVAAMNRDYRGKDRPTNVLSFPGGPMDGLPPETALQLGDIVLCPSVIAAEAREQGKKSDDHWAHLCVHGALHLAGYDHDNDADAAVMESLEVRILGALGIPDPYQVSQ